MSATAVIDPAVIDPARRARPEERTRTPRIEAVPSSRTQSRPKLVYGIVAVAGLFAIIVVQLLVSVGLSQGAYQISALQTEQKSLTRSNAEKQDAVDTLSSPQNLATAAQGLGMVANTAPVYLRLSDGAVLGDPSSAASSEVAGTAATPLVPNALVPARQPGVSASSPAVDGAAVPLQGELPAPITH
ncbi:hypothetical protein C5C31_06305 [Rathayibacter rathayi]|uniref:hypothetical protein n=1 Tax=Rathayibacter rathayi TaxID=33887 RepID=UPI000CE7C155|nr:hypothetical protein [Rathayibacter rathayi]PPF23191.1 hypothetical protein C5C34_09695 [Rathayibacter rathayi]PPG68569.1 hypothetical protein C5C02_07595 [Rathayibacter rathayi]PPG76442.1 hypothetical protein C5C23_07825 [Rathayibacter rathayi]PPG96597.1 hypothetical protein C5C22_02995 [Rathayibacter rathayi]PPH24536.1 hypothetical protein C5C31_06305 [Rathayibacter rathayi]